MIWTTTRRPGRGCRPKRIWGSHLVGGGVGFEGWSFGFGFLGFGFMGVGLKIRDEDTGLRV